ncbi:hypothetical protein H2198_000201 [Neophaeococcomyces mojaviensis]|uniref:Uncharacterized protein n=1 Tax=Neophaeococcomyces mojaviensis TaxID=3383035 RepID=A0ACC3AKN7_9EURO|nr:hypothetical protein H2198_000201 [Knufia sp. JES_112]
METHSDFDLPWCKELLTSPTVEITNIPTQDSRISGDKRISNSMFSRTLYTSTAIRAQINFKRPTQELDAITPYEYCYLLSIGSDLDGMTGRAHGGFNAMILDQITGEVSSNVTGSFAPATATMTVDYKAPIDTPGIILVRGWVVEMSGRKTWAKAVLEDGDRRVLASGKALFISPREKKI